MTATPLQIAAARSCTHMEVCAAELDNTVNELTNTLPHPLSTNSVRLLQHLLSTASTLRSSARQLDEASQ